MLTLIIAASVGQIQLGPVSNDYTIRTDVQAIVDNPGILAGKLTSLGLDSGLTPRIPTSDLAVKVIASYDVEDNIATLDVKTKRPFVISVAQVTARYTAWVKINRHAGTIRVYSTLSGTLQINCNCALVRSIGYNVARRRASQGMWLVLKANETLVRRAFK